MLKYELSEHAKEDLIRIFEYGVYQFGIKQADDYYDLLFTYFDSIARNPYSFATVDYIKLGYRRCVCKSNSIFYMVLESNIEIRAIVGNQDIQAIS